MVHSLFSSLLKHCHRLLELWFCSIICLIALHPCIEALVKSKRFGKIGSVGMYVSLFFRNSCFLCGLFGIDHTLRFVSRLRVAFLIASYVKSIILIAGYFAFMAARGRSSYSEFIIDCSGAKILCFAIEIGLPVM